MLAYRWDGKRFRLFFRTTPDSYNTDKLIAFFRHLKRELRGRKIVLMWDGLPAHKSRAMQDYLAQQRSWLITERLPGYAPDLNPVEMLWSHVKGRDLANFCAENLGAAAGALRGGMAHVRRQPHLGLSFLQHAGLFF